MLNKIPKIKAPTPNRNRNAFDLSQRHLFTAHAGMLLPVLSLDLLPHDHVEINATDFMRTLPMNTAAFASLRGVYEFFFVPYHQVWGPFDQFITGMNDYNSYAICDLYDATSPDSVPSFNLQELYDTLETRKENKDLFGYPAVNGAYRLLDLLGYSRMCDSSLKEYFEDDSGFVFLNDLDHTCNPFRILAYNKIYNDFYRNTTYEASDCFKFNIDSDPGDFDINHFADLFQLRYRNTQTDYFTNVRPSQLFSLPSFSFEGLTNSLGGLIGDSIGFSFSNPGTSRSGDDTYFNAVPGDGKMSTSVRSIRTAFALDKLASVTMRAGKTFYEQMKAHYGVEIPDSRDGLVSYLGGFDSDFQVSDVTQTSGSTGVSDSGNAGYLGKVAGKGTGSGSGRIVFDAKEHGVLMCIYSVVPQLQYDCTRIDPMVEKTTRFDFFTPEFENLGMQPLNSENVSSFVASAGKVLGYQPRYSEYKTALDINHGQFCNTDALSSWSVGRLRKHQGIIKFSVDMLKINPNMLDDVFPVKYNGTELTDCVFGGCNFNIVKVSDMSVDGMPRV